MAKGIQSSWGRMSDEAKMKKLLLVEAMCESLRSTVAEEGEYQKWAQHRLLAVLDDIDIDTNSKQRRARGREVKREGKRASYDYK